MSSFLRQELLFKKFQIVCTFDTINSVKEENEHEEFVAIMEGIELPIYVFTYSPEMIQFVHTDFT